MVISLTDFRPRPRFDGNSWSGAVMQGRSTDDGEWTPIEEFVFEDPDNDGAQPKARSFTAEDVPSDTKWLRMVFTDDVGGEDVTEQISVTPLAGALTSLRDVRLRRGEGDLSAEEEMQAQYLVTMATIGIYSAAGKPSTWTPTADQRHMLSLLATEMVVRAMRNPSGVQAAGERVGTYSWNETYTDGGAGVLPTKAEELMIGRVANGSNTASVTVRSAADDYADNIWWPNAEWEYALWYGSQPDPVLGR